MRQSPAETPAKRAQLPADEPRVRRTKRSDRARPRRRRSDRAGAGEQPKPIGEALLAAGVIDRTTLRWALARQEETGERVGQILLAAGSVHRLELQKALGDQWGLPFVDLLAGDVDADLVRSFPAELLLAEGWVPVEVERGRTVVATCEPPSSDTCERIRGHFPPKTKLSFRTTTPIDIERTVLLCFRKHFVRRSTGELLARRPDLSAAGGWSVGQKRVAAGAGLLLVLGLLAQWQLTLALVVAGANLVFLAAVGFKLVACLVGVSTGARAMPSGLVRDDRLLPRYTVLVPVYREANVIGELMDNLGRLDYPAEKLEILVLLESDDTETIDAARAARPPATVRLVIVPDAAPKTKPKACNVGLVLARGDLLVIYDAEDRPDPQQLRKAVAAFEQAGPQTVCMQARLRYWNSGANLLTRMFSLEYGYWFGTMLPGLDRLGLPIPLGGTSNHFRVAQLRGLLGWDPHNVTEDADLGLRAAVEGYRVGVIDSDTDEEACARLAPWIRQRTRWIKGYMQTALVHARSPRRLVRQVGVVDAAGFLLLIAGTPLTFLLAPAMWAGTAAWYGFGEPHLPLLDSGAFWTIATINLIVGNGIMIALNVLAAVRGQGWRAAPFALLNPLYWVLHSIAAWRAAVQLIRNPFYWEKTPHGLGAPARPPAPEPQPAS
ncbi:MAG TPA: glycosyltransferase [Solirubrobacteraceae bacterium]|jgi:cellulose synthase/poly-beta-1,6-N-acetylglucosamine synthase-like glycosyltransferase|nr:glycosyltransferase [Solirubrobacteraceae bacterium]